MADGLVKMSDQFGGLPMDQLIGGPLKAACDSQVQLAKATADFIQNVGLETDSNGVMKARTVDFTYTKPVNDGSGGYTEITNQLDVPILAILNTPSLQVKEVEVDFTMEVKSSTSEKSSRDYEAAMDTHVKAGWGPVSVDVKIHGSISAKSESTRSSDNSAKYNVKVIARDDGMPEGLKRCLDIVQSAIAEKPAAAPPVNQPTNPPTPATRNG
jgi:hypothetical protein|tara:strand:+ start:2179 stop:2817 length:639 start_codon:yes stop_codon:yes gene_type:complete